MTLLHSHNKVSFFFLNSLGVRIHLLFFTKKIIIFLKMKCGVRGLNFNPAYNNAYPYQLSYAHRDRYKVSLYCFLR